jgi:hypothetical protein
MRSLVEAAEQKSVALVVIDPHRDSLAAGLLEHLVARGMKKRILFDRLAALDRVLGFDWLPASDAKSELVRWTENEEQIRAFADVLCRRRQLESLAAAPTTEEWVIAALTLYVEQDRHPPLTDLAYAFDRGHPTFTRMLDGCRNSDVVRKFREIEQKAVSRGQYGAAERLIRGVCTSPAFAIRCGATFHLDEFLDDAGILIIEGGGTISDDAMRTMMGAVILRTIRYVRTRPRPHPPVILVLDEATNADLISSNGFEARAAAELQKSNFSLHVMVQNLNFPSVMLTEDLLTNCLRHEWFFTANATVAHKAAIDLGERDYEQQLRQLKPGERFVKERDRVYREYVPLLEDLWGFPGLGRKKAERALIEIQQRPEFRTPTMPAPTESVSQQPTRRRTAEENPNLGI